MNDFTKEELQILLLEMNISINRHKDLLRVAPSYQALRDKVDVMIDSYCEHEWSIGGADCIYCPKCEKEVFYK
jgi:hypothetical protein